MKNKHNRNDKVIFILPGTTIIDDEEFKDYTNTEEFIIPDTVTEIGNYAFSNCVNLKRIVLPSNLKYLGEYVFANCKSLEEIIIPDSLTCISKALFGYCTNLVSVKLHDNIEYIDDFAFYNCRKLRDFEIPSNLKSIGIKALSGCNKIKKINIPESLTTIELGAFSLMSSLTEINVSYDNPVYMSDEGIALLDKKEGILLQYAINSKNKKYVVGYYCSSYGEELDIPMESLTYNISDYAFAGAKFLEELYIPSELDSIGTNTFLNCRLLKTLNIFHTPYGNTLLLNVFLAKFKECHIPFEVINIEEGVTTLSDNLCNIFRNARIINLPSSLENIGTNVFNLCKRIKSLNIPKGIKSIQPNTFPDDMIINFKDFGEIRGSLFNMLLTKTSDDFYTEYRGKGNIRIFSLSDGTYYVSIDDYDVVKINRDEIETLSSSSYLLKDDPDIFIDYLNNLLSLNSTSFLDIISNDELRNKFASFIEDVDYIKEISMKKNDRAIHDILSVHDLDDETLFNGVLMRSLSKQDLELIVNNMNKSLERFFKFSKYFDPEYYDISKESNVGSISDNIPKIINYCKILEKYKVYDRFLYDYKLFINMSLEEIELMVCNYNANFKRLIILSKILETSNYNGDNLRDLLKLCRIMGVFDKDKVWSQKACTFIMEKIFSESNPLGDVNESRIIGDDIHRIFSDLHVREEIDYEFIRFFIENYKELIYLEKTASGFIARVYDSFREISRCSSSDKGEQRHLKVTIDKCKNFFLMQVYNNIDDEYRELATLLAKYYSDVEILGKAIMILDEAKKAPRNIFTKVEYDKNNKPIYDYDPSHDLKGGSDIAFTYEWLPKQSYDNLVLGKNCNCCAHINGAGAGIMRASMVLDCCQNLVIRDSLGNIVAKMTIWVNKLEGYAIYNTVEMNLLNRNRYGAESVYKAFMEGTRAFLEEYNKNNPEHPITVITVGSHRNVLKDYLEENCEAIAPLKGFDYSKYGYQIGDKMVGTYAGDHETEQLLVLKKI